MEIDQITQEQKESAEAANLYTLRKRIALAKVISAIETARAELKDQAQRLKGVGGKTATEKLDLMELSEKYETAAHTLGKLWGYQRGRLERMDAELREAGVAVPD